MWAGGTFFPVVLLCCVSVWFLREQGFYCLSVRCAVLAITTGKKKIQLFVWRVVLLYCVSFWFWREIGSFFVTAGNFYYDRKKKDTVVCLLGARFWRLRPEKKDTVVCLAGCSVVSVFGSGDYDRKKKVTVVSLAGCAVVSVFGSGDYDRKKSYSRLSRICISFSEN